MQSRRWLLACGLGLIVALLAGLLGMTLPSLVLAQPDKPKVKAPEFEPGLTWLNTDKAITIKELKGKIVLLDFWTLCCINCIHVMPDLEKLEKKYPNELVVIGVHSPKFENEKQTESIRKAILRYEIKHPVVNDANSKVWKTFGVNAWPTIVLIDPEGNFVGYASGEGNYEVLDKVISKLIKEHKEKKTLDEKPRPFNLVREKEQSPLFFPGKVLADEKGGRLFIADSTNHRIVITDLAGKFIAAAGIGKPGKADGPFDKAGFNDPQGMAIDGDTLYVADRKNHLIRALDLKAKTVKTVAGSGEKGDDRNIVAEALKIGLNSPWDLLLHDGELFIAMAGHHQIWSLSLKKNELGPYAGNGRENILDGTLAFSEFAQPSGLTTDGKTLWVADSETSSIRAVDLGGNRPGVKTVVGRGLFEFGDVDGEAAAVRLQHALGVLYLDGKLFVADTYNSKLKVLDPVKRTSTTYLGGKKTDLFNEPGGLSHANGRLYVADTNAHRIQVVDLKSKDVTTLKLDGVPAVKRD